MSEWEHRFSLIRPYLARFQRRFSVLDLGCGDGQITRAIAREFNASCFLIDQGFNDTDEYATRRYEGIPRITCIKHKMDADLLVRMSESERFDVVLALNFLHHFGWDWQPQADAVLNLGWHVFVQLPRVGVPNVAGCDIMAPLHGHLLQQPYTLLGETVQYPGHLPRPLWLFERPAGRTLPRTTMFAADGSAQGHAALAMQVRTGYDAEFQTRSDKWDGWVPRIVGMNLWNLLHLGVVRPSHAEMAAKVRAFSPPAPPHGDIVPWNFLWDGEALALCDWGGQFQRADWFGIEQTARIVEAATPRYPAVMDDARQPA